MEKLKTLISGDMITVTGPNPMSLEKNDHAWATLRGLTRVFGLTLNDATTTIPDRALSFWDDNKIVIAPIASLVAHAVTEVGKESFKDCTALSSVSLPAVKVIGEWAFYYCTALSNVNLPAVTEIGVGAFYYCNGLKDVNLPAVAVIGRGAFASCTALTNITFGDTMLVDVEPTAFYELTQTINVFTTGKGDIRKLWNAEGPTFIEVVR